MIETEINRERELKKKGFTYTCCLMVIFVIIVNNHGIELNYQMNLDLIELTKMELMEMLVVEVIEVEEVKYEQVFDYNDNLKRKEVVEEEEMHNVE